MNFWQNTILQIIGALALAVFGRFIGKKVIMVHKSKSGNSSTKWKWVIFIGTIVMWYCLLIFLSRLASYGFQDPYAWLALLIAICARIATWTGYVFK